MVIPRYKLLPEGQEGAIHCISRCVRRSYLCGRDAYSNKNFDHRKVWVKNRLKKLSSLFAIEVAGYSIMENHLHTLLWVRSDKVPLWTDHEVATRWLKIFPNSTDCTSDAREPTEQEVDILVSNPKKINQIRERLISISWFNRCLKENIAKRANLEDGCTGRFWEGRFKSIALLNEAAILACMQYIDLNPIRAGMAETPEQSDFTSAQDRIVARQARDRLRERSMEQDRKSTIENEIMTADQAEMIIKDQENADRDAWLSPIKRKVLEDEKSILNLCCDEYLTLLGWTGCQLREGKKGCIPENLEPILVRLEIETGEWLNTVNHFGNLFSRVAGSLRTIIKAARQAGQKWLKGQTSAKAAFG